MTKKKVSAKSLLYIVIIIIHTYIDSDRDRLFYMVYERVTVSPNTILPHLWSYRSRITLEHLSQTLSTQKHRILNEFLKQV